MRQTSSICFMLAASIGFGCGSTPESECLDVPAMPAATEAALSEFVSCRGYIDWPAETMRNPTTAPHGDETRVYINSTLETSLAASNTEHPVNSTAVKEIFRSGELAGWAAMIKVAEGTGNSSWYWYEVLDTAPGTTPVAASIGAAACTGCHQNGTDFFRTIFPLR